jgi:hypothetical protein
VQSLADEPETPAQWIELVRSRMSGQGYVQKPQLYGLEPMKTGPMF